MAAIQKEYKPPIISGYGQDTSPEDLANLFVKKKLNKKNLKAISDGSSKLYGYEAGSIGVNVYAAANAYIVVNAAVYANVGVATMALAVLAVVTFPGNMQRLQSSLQ